MKTSKADKYFSLYIRLRDSDDNGFVRCCTCGIVRHWKQVDNGHFIKRQHNASRFSEVNCNAQCKGCNCFEQGANEKYAEFIKEKHGIDKYNLLLASKNKHHKFTQFEIDQIAEIYKQKALQLAKEKGQKI